MMMLSSNRSATLRRMLRISSSGKSTDKVSRPVASLLLVALVWASPSLMVTSTAEGTGATAFSGAGTDGGSLAVTLNDYRDTLCPMFDLAYTGLLDDLRERGMLDNTLVVAMGEFGRTPQLNARGGRDHHPGVWSILFAGARVRGGQVIGASDRIGAEPRDRPVTPAEIAATIYRGLGIDLGARLPGPENRPLPLIEAEPVDELFRA